MRKIISLMHISLDGFAAVPNGDMNWVKVDEVPKVRRTPSENAFGEIFDQVGGLTLLSPYCRYVELYPSATNLSE